MKLSYTRVRAPFGEVLVVESERGVVAIELGSVAWEALEARLAGRLGEPVTLARAKASKSAGELSAYLAGRTRHLDVPIDWRGINGFSRDVLRALARVPFGKLVSYGQLAAKLGKPGAARAVGGAMARNPIPIVLPCHRVVASDGSLGGFSGGLPVKRWLHAHEGAKPLSGGWSTRAERHATEVRRTERAPKKRVGQSVQRRSSTRSGELATT